MSSDLMIEVRGLTKSYSIQTAGSAPTTLKEALARRARHPLSGGVQRERFVALDDVSFCVDQGEVVGLVGGNGAGKSTLLKLLSRVTYADQGEIRLHGRVASLLEVGTGFHPELTGRENIHLNGTILGMTRRQVAAQFDDIVAFAEVEQFIDTPVKRYSSGMYLRLAFAIAAHLEPEILIIDEVLSVGDASFQKKCLGKMDEVRRHGRTILFVSHNLVAVEALCTRALYLEHGVVRYDGDTQTAISRYLVSAPTVGREVSAGTFERAPAVDGTEPPAVRRVVVQNDAGEPSSVVRMGRPVSFLIDVETQERAALYVGVRFRSETNQLLAGMNTRMLPDAPRIQGSRLQVSFTLPRLQLTPGHYSIDVGVATQAGEELVDLAEKVAAFEVAPADVYGSGYAVTHGEGVLFMDFHVAVGPN